MKRRIVWHKGSLETLENWSAAIERDIQCLQDALQKSRQEQAFYREQIKRAEAEGRDGFDQEKFGVKRAKQ